MQLRAPFASCSTPAARPWMQLHAPHLLPHRWIRACYHMRGTAAPEETTFACAPLSCLLMKHLQHTSETNETFTTYICNICNIQYNTCNIGLKQLRHLKHTLTIYMYSQCNICNIQIQHLQHTFEIAKTYTSNIHV
jgi:hypothetical protein